MEESGVHVGSVVGFGRGNKGKDAASRRLRVWLGARPGIRVLRQESQICVCILPDGRIIFNTVLILKYQEG